MEELRNIAMDLSNKVAQKNTQLVKCLRNRERHRNRCAKHCDMITAVLQACSSKSRTFLSLIMHLFLYHSMLECINLVAIASTCVSSRSYSHYGNTRWFELMWLVFSSALLATVWVGMLCLTGGELCLICLFSTSCSMCARVLDLS